MLVKDRFKTVSRKLFDKWVSKGRYDLPRLSPIARQGGTNRRTLLLALASTLGAAATPVAADQPVKRIFGIKPAQVLTVSPGTSWTPTAAGATAFAVPDTIATAPGTAPDDYRLNTTLLGDGSWTYRAVANIDEPEDMILSDQSKPVMVAMGYTGDPSGLGIKEVVIYCHGNVVTIPGHKMALGTRTGSPGWEFRLALDTIAHAGKWGRVRVTVVVRPYNGYEWAVTRSYVLDDFGVSGRKTFTIDPVNGNDGATAAAVIAGTAKWKSLNAALAKCTDAAVGLIPIVQVPAGVYDAVAQTSGYSTNPNTSLITVRPTAGLTRDKVTLFRSSPVDSGTVSSWQRKSAPIAFSARRVLFQGLTFDTALAGGLQVNAQLGRLYYQDFAIVDSLGYRGPTADTMYGSVTDPDEDGTTDMGAGGFGFYFPAGVSGDQTLTTFSYGTAIAFMEGTVRTAAFRTFTETLRRNINGEAGYDVLYLGATFNGRRNIAGEPACDNENALFVNTFLHQPWCTGYRLRYHDHNVLKVAGVQAFYPAGTTYKYPSGTTKTLQLGITVIALDLANNPTLKQNTAGQVGSGPAGDDHMRLVRSPGMITAGQLMPMGSRQQAALGLAQGGDEFDNQGFRLAVIGGGTSLTINGAAQTFDTSVVVVFGDCRGLAAGDLITCFNVGHTDTWQSQGGVLNQPGFNNWMAWNYRSYGPGSSQSQLFQSRGIGTAGALKDSGGNYVTRPGVYTGLTASLMPYAIDASGIATPAAPRFIVSSTSGSNQTVVAVDESTSIGDAFSVVSAGKTQNFFVTAVVDAATGKLQLDRPPVDANGAAVALSTTPAWYKSIRNMALVNWAVTSAGSPGEWTSPLWNCHYRNATIFPGITFNSGSFRKILRGCTIRDSVMGPTTGLYVGASPHGTVDLRIMNTALAKGAISDAGSTGTGGPMDGVTSIVGGLDLSRVGGATSCLVLYSATYPDPAALDIPLLATRIIAANDVPWDINGVRRVPGTTKIGARAA